MSRLTGWVMAGLAATAALGGCAGNHAGTDKGDVVTAEVSGTVTYLERIALPATATVRVQLVDVSRADAAAVVLGEQTIEAAGRQVPFSFVIDYDPGTIDPRHTYAVQARIEDDGNLLFISDRHYPVITREVPDRVDMTLTHSSRSVLAPGRPPPGAR